MRHKINRQRLCCFFMFLTFSLTNVLLGGKATASGCPSSATYEFREGDTLSEVLWFLGSEPVYGKRGWIEKTWALNPELRRYKGKNIPPRTKMIIPIKKCPLQGGWIIEKGMLIAPYHHANSLTTPSPAKDVPTPQPSPEPTSVPSPEPTSAPAPAPTSVPPQPQTPVQSRKSERHEKIRCPSSATYEFREGDTLSEVLWFLGSEPVYGKRGWIEKTWAINPTLREFRGKEIPPRTKLKIPLKKCPPLGGWTIENDQLIAPYHHPKQKLNAPSSEPQPAQPPTPESIPDMSEGQNKAPAEPPPETTTTATPAPTPTATPKPAATPTPTAAPTPAATPAAAPTPTATPTPAAATPAAAPTKSLTPKLLPKPNPTAKASSPVQSQQPTPLPKAGGLKTSPVKTNSPKPILTPTQGPADKLRSNLKNSKEVFEKNREKEEKFLRQLKEQDDFVRQ